MNKEFKSPVQLAAEMYRRLKQKRAKDALAIAASYYKVSWIQLQDYLRGGRR
jgi:hypothetical protein